MKKIVMILSITLSLFIYFVSVPVNVNAEEKEVDYIDYIEQDGVIAEKLTQSELIKEISELYNISETEIKERLGISNLTRDSQNYEYYRLSKEYTYQFGTGIRYFTFTHNAYVNMTRTNDYTADYVNIITGVLGYGVLMSSGDYYFEESLNSLKSWNSSSVNLFWAGNVCLETSASIGVGGGVTVGGSNPYIYRLYKEITSTISCPQW